ncbi:MAG: hypothetical protein AMXMBFR84_49450 [Candidatus Hydrogenedentota bacterium]
MRNIILLCLGVLIVGVAGGLIWNLMQQRAPEPPPALSDTHREPTPAVPPAATPPPSPQATSPDPLPMAESVRPLALPYVLKGTVVGPVSIAMIANTDTGAEGKYSEGELLEPGVVVNAINNRQVVLEARGEIVILEMGTDLNGTLPDLSGTWRAEVVDDNGNGVESVDVSLSQSGNELTISVDNSTFSGTLVGLQVQFKGLINDNDATITGSFDPLGTVYKGEMRSLAPEAAQTNEMVMAVTMTRLTQEQIVIDVLKVSREKELLKALRTVYASLKEFAEQNNGIPPRTLEELASKNPDLLNALTQEGTQVTYYNNAFRHDKQVEAIRRSFYAEGTPTVDQLRAMEAALTEVWGGQSPYARPLIRVQDNRTGISISMDGFGSISNENDSRYDSARGNADEPVVRAMIASDQNNMKQLGLVIKMFMNEHDNIMPPGWNSVYPEYLTDMNVLRSPWDAPGEQSYEYLFPTATEESLLQLAADLVNSGQIASEDLGTDNPQALNAQLMSKVPILFNQAELPRTPGRPAARNVLFLDGHVEVVPTSEWNARITPFQQRAG